MYENISKYIESALEMDFGDTFFVIESNNLTPRSTLRKLFEGRSELAAVPCYEDDRNSLRNYILDLANKDLSIWHKLKENKIKILRNQKLNSKDESMFFKNLYKFGYSKMNKNKFFLIKAFQRRFRQSLINGKVDKECLIISKSLTKS